MLNNQNYNIEYSGRTKAISMEKEKVWAITELISLLGIATIAPLLGHQMLTGVGVNATLIIATVLLGLRYSVLVGLIPSIIAVSVGLLPFVMAPMIPFIIAGNIILIYSFHKLYKTSGYWAALFVGAVLKFIFIYLTSIVVVGVFIQTPIASKISQMMSWPQLFNAIGGGIVAYVFLKSIKKIK